MNKLTNDQLIEIFHIIFPKVHSIGFMIDETNAVLFDNTYWFLEKPNEFWYNNVIQYLADINFDIQELNINPSIV